MSDATRAVHERPNVKDALAGAVVAVAGGVLLIEALSFEGGSAQTDPLGPRLFPLLASTVLVLGGLVLLGSSVRRLITKARGDQQADLPKSSAADFVAEAEQIHQVPFIRLIVVIAIFTGYLMIFAPLGFLLSTALFMTVMTSYVRPDRVILNAVIGSATSLCIYLSFTELLDVVLPAGPLG